MLTNISLSRELGWALAAQVKARPLGSIGPLAGWDSGALGSGWP